MSVDSLVQKYFSSVREEKKKKTTKKEAKTVEY